MEILYEFEQTETINKVAMNDFYLAAGPPTARPSARPPARPSAVPVSGARNCTAHRTGPRALHSFRRSAQRLMLSAWDRSAAHRTRRIRLACRRRE